MEHFHSTPFIGGVSGASNKLGRRLLLLTLSVALLFPAINSFAGGSIRAWGENGSGQCSVPDGLTNVVAVAGGGLHSLALNGGGIVTVWGWNVLDEVNIPAGLTNVTAIAANYGYSLALKGNGTVVAWGSLAGTVPAGLSNVTAIAAGYDHKLALRSDGSVAYWGGTNPPPASLSNVVAIAAGNGHSLALKLDGTITAWGNNTNGQTTVPAGATNIVAVAAGGEHSLALRADGVVLAWGSDSDGQTDVPANLAKVIAITAGSGHNMALKADGKVVAWGRNDFGQAVTSTNLVGVTGLSAGLYHNLAIVGDGTPVITVQPVDQTLALSKDAVFRVFAAGNQPLSYQWTHNGENLAGSTSSVCRIRNVQWPDAGVYRAVVFNSFGSVISAPAILSPVAKAPWIIGQPEDVNVFCGEDTRFQVVLDGTAPFYYQWYFNEAPVADATNSVLALNQVTPFLEGQYSVVVSNAYGSITSGLAQMTVTVEAPLITSPLTASGKQGDAFTYTITGLHAPTEYGAYGLPAGLTVNPTNGVIEGVPLESGLFNVVISTANACSEDDQLLELSLDSSVPVITSVLAAPGMEGANFNYQILASETPTTFGAEGLPLDLVIDSASGQITGIPVYGGESDVTIWASNVWGVGSATLHLSFGYAQIPGLGIANLTTNYMSPYLLEFEFSLQDNEDAATAHTVVVPPSLLSVTCKEDGKVISATETGAHIARGGDKQLKANLVLDFTASMASLSNGDSNGDGISDAVEGLVAAANSFVDSQPVDALIGVYEFHREDVAPQQVQALTTDRAKLHQAINGIWTNYVQGFTAGSVCWDALSAAIADLGADSGEEQRYVICVSDGWDESSIKTSDDVISEAKAANVKVSCIGFGSDPDTATLRAISTETTGRYYAATGPADIAAGFSQIGKDVVGQYIVRWATLKRGTKAFMPSFQLSYQGFTVDSPTNPITVTIEEPVDPEVDPEPTTNSVTNFIISYYTPADYAGDVTVGALRLVSDDLDKPKSVTLSARYIPRYVRRMRLQMRPNWPCTVEMQSTGVDEMLQGWSLSETNDGAGVRWLELNSPGTANYLPFAAFGKLVKFSLQDMTSSSNAFSLFAVDNTVYATNGPRFQIENGTSFVQVFPSLPYGTPVPWLIAQGFPNNFESAELSDPDRDGIPTWSEYRADTSPHSAASRFVVQTPTPTGLYGHYQLTFSTSANRTYRLESSLDLLTWEPLLDNISGTGAAVTVTDPRGPANSSQMYYRVLVW